MGTVTYHTTEGTSFGSVPGRHLHGLICLFGGGMGSHSTISNVAKYGALVLCQASSNVGRLKWVGASDVVHRARHGVARTAVSVRARACY